jgi:hypothetical protein
MSVDLDINNYNLEDILKLFKIPVNFDEHVKTDEQLYKLKVFIRNTIGK